MGKDVGRSIDEFPSSLTLTCETRVALQEGDKGSLEIETSSITDLEALLLRYVGRGSKDSSSCTFYEM